MEDAFFSQLDGNAVRELLLRTELRHAALFAVSDTLRIERCSDAAQQLSGLHPMEELDPFLSGSTRNILLRCINTQSACTAEEDIDGTVYTVEMIPHRGGALLAYLRRDRAAYDGSLRVIQDKSSRYLGALMAEAEQVEDPALADGLRRQCMRLYRLLTHSDLLHDPLLTEQLSLRRCDLSALCRDAVQQAETHAPVGSAKFIVQVPEHADALIDTRLVRTAIYNLLTNALRVTPEDGEITVSLTDTRDFVTIAVADTGPGLDPAKFDDLLSGWRRTTSITGRSCAAAHRLVLACRSWVKLRRRTADGCCSHRERAAAACCTCVWRICRIRSRMTCSVHRLSSRTAIPSKKLNFPSWNEIKQPQRRAKITL